MVNSKTRLSNAEKSTLLQGIIKAIRDWPFGDKSKTVQQALLCLPENRRHDISPAVVDKLWSLAKAPKVEKLKRKRAPSVHLKRAEKILLAEKFTSLMSLYPANNTFQTAFDAQMVLEATRRRPRTSAYGIMNSIKEGLVLATPFESSSGVELESTPDAEVHYKLDSLLNGIAVVQTVLTGILKHLSEQANKANQTSSASETLTPVKMHRERDVIFVLPEGDSIMDDWNVACDLLSFQNQLKSTRVVEQNILVLGLTSENPMDVYGKLMSSVIDRIRNLNVSVRLASDKDQLVQLANAWCAVGSSTHGTLPKMKLVGA
jgi:hypothetical protein